MKKELNILDLFSQEELLKLGALPMDEREMIIKQNYLSRINGVTGQDKNARYWAYFVEYVLTQVNL
jgi:hypothetical protein